MHHGRVEPTHIAFADESRYTSGRYRSLAVVSVERADRSAFDGRLRAILDESGVKELSWKNVTSARDRLAALKALDWTLRQASARKLRADVVTWDTHDTRHSIRRRDDISNLARMYHHLLENVMGGRWPEDAMWTVRPDENTAMTWDHVAEFLRLKERHRDSDAPQLWQPGKRRFYLLQVQPARSHEEPLVQLADVFAGLGSYSRLRYNAYKEWTVNERQQASLWEDPMSPAWSASERERFQVMRAFNEACKTSKFRVSLDTHGGFRTMHPASPVNFWWYEPQHEMDRAPTYRDGPPI
jgi:hypothetical protein